MWFTWERSRASTEAFSGGDAIVESDPATRRPAATAETPAYFEHFGFIFSLCIFIGLLVRLLVVRFNDAGTLARKCGGQMSREKRFRKDGEGESQQNKPANEMMSKSNAPVAEHGAHID
jgi:hypothetical protein